MNRIILHQLVYAQTQTMNYIFCQSKRGDWQYHVIVAIPVFRQKKIYFYSIVGLHDIMQYSRYETRA